MKTFTALDSLRGICALSVVLFHLRIFDSITEHPFFRGSGLFVQFFFMLSGFVMAHSYLYRKDIKIKPFLLARIFRIYPLHLCMLITTLLLELGKLFAFKGGIRFNSTPFTGKMALSELIPNFFLVHSLTQSTNHLSFNYPSWSISVEMFLYTLFVLSLLTSRKVQLLLWPLLLTSALLHSLAPGEIIAPELLSGIYCFFGGVITYILFMKFHHLFQLSVNMATLLELIAILSIVFFIMLNKTSFTAAVPLTIVLFAGVIYLFSLEKGKVARFLMKPQLNYIGKISYSIYMTHAAILFVILSLIMITEKFLGISLTIMSEGDRYISTGSMLWDNILVGIIVAIIIAVASLSYRLIEKTGIHIGKKIIRITS